MNAYLLSLLFFLTSLPGKTPNFYPNFIAAKEASKNYNKDLLIFFTKNSCSNCDAVWSDFEKDPIASKIYISTLLNIKDFDAAVVLDKYGLKNAPSWLVLDPQGQVKDKWEGEWKKTPTRPVAPVQETASSPALTKNNSPEMDVKETSATSVITTSPVTAQSKQEIVSQPHDVVDSTPPVKDVKVTAPVIEHMAEVTTTPAPPVVAGFVIQAGFFSSPANAKGLIMALETKGFDNFSIKPSMRDGTNYYRVISTTYASEKEAQVKIDEMQKADIKATIKNSKEIAD